MSVHININGETAAEALSELRVIAIQLAGPQPVAGAQLVSQQAAPETAAPAPVAAKATTTRKKTEPAAPPAAPAAAQPETKPAAQPDPQAGSDEDDTPATTLAEVRAFLEPFMKDPTAGAEAAQLIKDVGLGKRLSQFEPDDLARLLREARVKLAAAA